MRWLVKARSGEILDFFKTHPSRFLTGQDVA